jgi:hypothetical protein
MRGRPVDPGVSGKRFGRLIAGEAVRKPGKWHIRCKCDCGNETLVRCDHLKSGRSSSCGCYSKTLSSLRSLKHGDSRIGGKRAPEFGAWAKMNDRCRNPRNNNYNRYGGRGISVCQEWQESYTAFLAAMGRRPSVLHSLERINNNGNYDPGNVRWATKVDQCNNRRTNRLLEFNGKIQTLAQWGREVGIPSLTLGARLNRGWSAEKTLTEALR